MENSVEYKTALPCSARPGSARPFRALPCPAMVLAKRYSGRAVFSENVIISNNSQLRQLVDSDGRALFVVAFVDANFTSIKATLSASWVAFGCLSSTFLSFSLLPYPRPRKAPISTHVKLEPCARTHSLL